MSGNSSIITTNLTFPPIEFLLQKHYIVYIAFPKLPNSLGAKINREYDTIRRLQHSWKNSTPITDHIPIKINKTQKTCANAGMASRTASIILRNEGIRLNSLPTLNARKRRSTVMPQF